MGSVSLKEKLKSFLPWPFYFLFRKLRSLPEDLPVLLSFIFRKTVAPTTFFQRLKLVFKCYRISYSVDSPHMENEIIQVMAGIFALKPGQASVIVEAGAYKGSSTAKLSLAASIANRQLFVFDSFQGLPEHQEVHGKNIFGGDAYFPPGSYAGSLAEVKNNIKKFGVIDVCHFQKGWFENTMPEFKQPVGAAYIDVDLESSTEICLRYLYPLLVPGGVLFSQDGHLPWIVKLLSDDEFWEKEVRYRKPKMSNLGAKKLVAIEK